MIWTLTKMLFHSEQNHWFGLKLCLCGHLPPSSLGAPKDGKAQGKCIGGHPRACRGICVLVNLCSCAPGYLRICASVYSCICESVYLCMCICASVYLSICVSVYLCICVSVYLCICVCAARICVSVYLSVFVSVSKYLRICVSVHMCICVSVPMCTYICVCGCARFWRCRSKQEPES